MRKTVKLKEEIKELKKKSGDIFYVHGQQDSIICQFFQFYL